MRRLRVQSCAEQGAEELFPAAAALSMPLGHNSSGDTLFSLPGIVLLNGDVMLFRDSVALFLVLLWH